MKNIIFKGKDQDYIFKYNPYHGKDGRFSSRDEHTTFSPGKDQRTAARSIDNENTRRKKEGMNQLVSGAYSTIGKQDYSTVRANYLKDQAAKINPIQQMPKPLSAGQPVDWLSMDDDTLMENLEKYMPGIHDVATKGWASNHPPSEYIDTKKNGDMVLTDIYAARGYHAKPEIMSKDDIKDYIKTNNTPELYRGMGNSSSGQSGADKQTRFAEDDLHFAGLGVLGNGTYAAETPKNNPARYNTGLSVARSYARGGGGDLTGTCVRMTLKKGTKTASVETIRKEQRDFRAKLNGDIDIEKDFLQQLFDITEDTGRFAALRGYEAWYDNTGNSSGASPIEPYWVVVNRGQIIIQKERYDA